MCSKQTAPRSISKKNVAQQTTPSKQCALGAVPEDTGATGNVCFALLVNLTTKPTSTAPANSAAASPYSARKAP
tara:strand:+ start:501 stop:722 length:222 start_codon:yes stop_codon:yes gene_type:complete